MVSRISPDYYAAEAVVGDYTVEGIGFGVIPDTAIGIVADHKGKPLEYLDTELPQYIFDIVTKSDSEIFLRQRLTRYHSLNNYLGAIVSADRETIYWTNTADPLP